ncbi:MAG: ribosomal protein L7/L12 [Phoenicibacter congonensis]|uniref:Ribosomal protein L7/L12 n=1 Tax=Phoenicibacter congonensis TaxID=1944646 RepID=A0AA43U9W5_9ACTN|nr:ribosomal protein L7/L12 [Phoenicibacter congonensis]
MALITCPECGKQISDKAPACIHCGYPLQEQQTVAPTVVATSKKVAIPSFVGASPQKIPAIKVVREITGMGLAEAKEFVEQAAPYVIVKDGLSDNQANVIVQKFKAEGVDAHIFASDAPVTFVSHTKDKDIISCPQCGSTQYHAGARGFSLITGFVGSGKTVLTCLKCGNRWKPGK